MIGQSNLEVLSNVKSSGLHTRDKAQYMQSRWSLLFLIFGINIREWHEINQAIGHYYHASDA